MHTAYLGLGSNKGDRLAHLQAAVARLQKREGLRVVAASPVYETEAHTASQEKQPPFLNAVLRVTAECLPESLLHMAREVERAEGRVRKINRQKWQPRPLDVDLLAVDDITCQTDALTLPHPRLGQRRFVLRPWADLAPNFVVPPPFDQSVQSLLDQCPDTIDIRRTKHRLNASTAGMPPE